MANGASRLFNVMRKTSLAMNLKPSQLVSLTVKSINPLILIREDRFEIPEDFCIFNKFVDRNRLKINDILTAIVLDDGQSYYIQENISYNDDTGWKDFSWKNDTYINNSQSAYTSNKWRVKNDVLYILIGVGSTSLIEGDIEIEVAQIPIRGNISFDSVNTRIWAGAVGSGGCYGGFNVRQYADHISIYFKSHSESAGQVGSWFSSHFVIPLDDSYIL